MSCFLRNLIPQLIVKRSVTKIAPLASRANCYSTLVQTLHKDSLTKETQANVTFLRYKSKKAKVDSDDEEENYNEEDASLARDSKIVKFNTTSMRADMILKSGLGVARNKIEQAFYESRIRVNGKKLLKKSASVREGDEVDVIKAVSPKNPDHIHVSRLEILSVVPKEEQIGVTTRRFKNLLIENYEQDPYKSSAPQEE